MRKPKKHPDGSDYDDSARLLEVLRDHPRGMATAVAARQASVPLERATDTLARLHDLDLVERPTEGFYRTKET